MPFAAPRTRGLSSVARAEKQFEPLIDAGELRRRDLPEHPADAPLVDRTNVIDECKRRLPKAAAAGCEGRIKGPDPGRSGDRHDRDQWKSLVRIHGRVTDSHARSHASLLVTDRRIEFDKNDSATFHRHADSLIQPCPSTQRTAVPPDVSSSPSSSGNSEVQSASPPSTN